VNYDNSLVVTITVTCDSWAPSSGDYLFTCCAIYRPPHMHARAEVGPDPDCRSRLRQDSVFFFRTRIRSQNLWKSGSGVTFAVRQ